MRHQPDAKRLPQALTARGLAFGDRTWLWYRSRRHDDQRRPPARRAAGHPGARPGLPPGRPRRPRVPRARRRDARRRAGRLAIEQADGSVFRFNIAVLPASHPHAAANSRYLERFVKFLLWSRGGWRIHVAGPAPLVAGLAAHYRDTATGRFDAHLVGERMFDHPLEIVHTATLPAERSDDETARPPPRRLPHRLRPRRQRSQGRGGR